MNRCINFGARWAMPAAVVALSLAGCGGGSNASESTPSFAGNYTVTLRKTVDDCNTSSVGTANIAQSVSQDGRTIALSSGSARLRGSVDSDNRGFSVSSQSTEDGVLLTSSAVYRSTSAADTFSTGLTAIASLGSQSCTVSYSGTAKRNS